MIKMVELSRDRRYSKKVRNRESNKADEDIPDVQLKWNPISNLSKSSYFLECASKSDFRTLYLLLRLADSKREREFSHVYEHQKLILDMYI